MMHVLVSQSWRVLNCYHSPWVVLIYCARCTSAMHIIVRYGYTTSKSWCTFDKLFAFIEVDIQILARAQRFDNLFLPILLHPTNEMRWRWQHELAHACIIQQWNCYLCKIFIIHGTMSLAKPPSCGQVPAAAAAAATETSINSLLLYNNNNVIITRQYQWFYTKENFMCLVCVCTLSLLNMYIVCT